MIKIAKPAKIVIIGAGRVGSHCAFSLAQSALCGEIVLIDIDRKKAHAQALDISDSISFSSHETLVRDGDYRECEGADLIVVAIGAARLPGQTRLDLLDLSVQMCQAMLKELNSLAVSCPVITITNPADIVADYVRKGLGMDRSQVFGTGTLLDSARLVRILSEESGISRTSISAWALGEHGDSSMIPFSSIRIAGQPFSEFGIPKERILEATREAGMTIINGKGSTEFGIGRALCEMAACILRDEKKLLAASVLLDGEYGQKDVHCGVPCVIGKNGIEKIVELPLDSEEQEQLAHSCQIIRSYINKVS